MKAPLSKPRPGAFTLIELLVIIVTVVVIACFLMPAIARGPRRARDIACVGRLKIVALSFKVWAIDNGDNFPMAVSTNGFVPNYNIPLSPTTNGPGTMELIGSGQAFVHFRVLSKELSTPLVLVCPADKAKAAATNFNFGFSDANVSYFVGVDAAEGTNLNMFLAGDRTLASNGKPLKPGLFSLTSNNASLTWTKAFHGARGNVALADGSVQALDLPRLAAAVHSQELATNRLAIP